MLPEAMAHALLLDPDVRLALDVELGLDLPRGGKGLREHVQSRQTSGLTGLREKVAKGAPD